MSVFSRTPVVAGVSALAITLTACAGVGSGASADSMADMAPVQLSFHYLSTPESHQGQGFKAFAEYIETESDGKITIDGYPSGTLLKAGEELEGVSSGLADMGLVIGNLEKEELPVLNWFDEMNTMLTSTAMPHSLLQLSVATNLVQAQSEAIQNEFKSHGVVPLTANLSDSSYGIQCTKPLTSLEDAKGVTVRVGVASHTNEAQALGMVPVNLPITEAYEALQRGVSNCVVGAATTMRDFGFWEIAQYYMPVKMSTITSVGLVVNEGTWNSLPADAQQLLQRGAYAFAEGSLTTTLDNYKKYAEEGPKYGVKIMDPRPLDAALNPAQAKAIEELLANPPQGLEDPEALVALFQESLARGKEVADAATNSPARESRDPETILAGFSAGSESVDIDGYFTMMMEELGVQ